MDTSTSSPLGASARNTTVALKDTVEFFRQHGVEITEIRMDNKQSVALLQMAKTLKIKWDLVSPYVKNPNRSERTIRTAETTSLLQELDSTPNVRTHIWKSASTRSK